MSSQWKETVVEVLKMHPDGLSIREISQECNVSRPTAALVLAELRGANKIRVRQVAAAKLHYWRDS